MKLNSRYRVFAVDAVFALVTLAVLGVLAGALQYGRDYSTRMIARETSTPAPVVAASANGTAGTQGTTISTVGEFVPASGRKD